MTISACKTKKSHNFSKKLNIIVQLKLSATLKKDLLFENQKRSFSKLISEAKTKNLTCEYLINYSYFSIVYIKRIYLSLWL